MKKHHIMAKEHNGAGIWFDPQNFVPADQEIIAIDCEVALADGGRARLIQTGMYAVDKTGLESWYVPRPFVRLLYWMRYPQQLSVENNIKQIKKTSIIS